MRLFYYVDIEVEWLWVVKFHFYGISPCKILVQVTVECAVDPAKDELDPTHYFKVHTTTVCVYA